MFRISLPPTSLASLLLVFLIVSYGQGVLHWHIFTLNCLTNEFSYQGCFLFWTTINKIQIQNTLQYKLLLQPINIHRQNADSTINIKKITLLYAFILPSIINGSIKRKVIIFVLMVTLSKYIKAVISHFYLFNIQYVHLP